MIQLGHVVFPQLQNIIAPAAALYNPTWHIETNASHFFERHAQFSSAQWFIYRNCDTETPSLAYLSYLRVGMYIV